MEIYLLIECFRSRLVPIDYIMTDIKKDRGNQNIQLVKSLYYKLPTNGKQLPAFPHEVRSGFKH